jgi:hypothetical protein
MKKTFFLFWLCLFLPVLAFAQAVNPAEKPPAIVDVGVYINNIYDMSLHNNSFNADFYVWFRWQNADLKPYETFEVANGRVNTREVIYNDKIKDLHYAVARVTATFTKFWNVDRFPLDRHTLTIELEDSQDEDFKLAYKPDAANSNQSPDLHIPGYNLAAKRAFVVSHAYQTNYGDISLPSNNESSYSRFVYAIDIQRPGYGYFLKLFLSVFIATLISFLSFAIKPTDLDPRFGLGIGAIFAAVASEYVVAAALPESSSITMSDMIHILSILFIFLALAESTISLQLHTRGKEGMSKSMDKLSLILMPIIYIVTNLIVIFG